MRRNSSGAIVFTESEVKAVALRLVARHLTQSADWLNWEDLPELSELTFLELCCEVAVLGEQALARSVANDKATGIDSVHLTGEAS